MIASDSSSRESKEQTGSSMMKERYRCGGGYSRVVSLGRSTTKRRRVGSVQRVVGKKVTVAMSESGVLLVDRYL